MLCGGHHLNLTWLLAEVLNELLSKSKYLGDLVFQIRLCKQHLVHGLLMMLLLELHLRLHVRGIRRDQMLVALSIGKQFQHGLGVCIVVFLRYLFHACLLRGQLMLHGLLIHFLLRDR